MTTYCLMINCNSIRRLIIALLLGSLVLFDRSALMVCADEPAPTSPAAILLRTTVTVRVCARKPSDKMADAMPDKMVDEDSLASEKKIPSDAVKEADSAKKSGASRNTRDAQNRRDAKSSSSSTQAVEKARESYSAKPRRKSPDGNSSDSKNENAKDDSKSLTATPSTATSKSSKTSRSRSAAARSLAITRLRANPPKSKVPPCELGCVSVCSGVSLGEGRIITFGHLPSLNEPLATNFRYRVTLPGGKQACAEAEVVDFYSGLVLLRVRNVELPKIELATALPPVGSDVLTAAAAGIETSLVSKGVLSGADRTLSGTNLPPMIQSDVSTTETSSGAPLINAKGQLIGVLAATEKPAEKNGWSYAVPVEHVKRLLDARVENRLIVLVRQRPWIGLRLGPGEEQGTVFVEQISRDGPAQAAGVQVGDQLLAADGVRVRSAYQAVVRVMKHQPGDKMDLRVERDGKEIDLTLELAGGGHVFANLPPRNQKQIVEATRDEEGRIELRSRRGSAELASKQYSLTSKKQTRTTSSLRLNSRINASLQVILKLQRQLEESRKEGLQSRERIEELEQELAKLRQKLESQDK